LFAIAIYRAVLAPDDYQQGATVKIMFLHVPSAWLGMLCWALMTVAALGTLVWRHPLADVTAKAAAPLGAAFTLPPRMGYLLGMGCAPDFGIDPVSSLPRCHCALAYG
jgi:ABC-type transport system involved in cytochrome c biogenesis permease subunit